MSYNILLTGAAGYIGGTILSNLLARADDLLDTGKLFAAVRTEEQVQILSKLGVTVLQIDLTDREAVGQAVLQNNINLVVHVASSIDSRLASNLIGALGQRRQKGAETFFIHSSVTALFAEENGWPHGEVRDTDPILTLEKAIAAPNPVRETNILVMEQGKEQNVKTFNVVVPVVYGLGTGEVRKLSVMVPAIVRSSVRRKTVYKFDKEGRPPAAHVSDVSALYILLIENILKGVSIPSGENGHYFAMAHRSPWWKVASGIAKSLHSRGLVDEPEPKLWPNYEMAADDLGFPRAYIRGMGMSSGDLVPVNAYKIGWKPQWDEKRYFDSIDDEVRDALALDTGGTSLYDTILPSKG